MKNHGLIDPFVHAYLRAALDSQIDSEDCMQARRDVDGFAPAAVAEAVEVCRAFRDANLTRMAESGLGESRIAELLWLARNDFDQGEAPAWLSKRARKLGYDSVEDAPDGKLHFKDTYSSAEPQIRSRILDPRLSAGTPFFQRKCAIFSKLKWGGLLIYPTGAIRIYVDGDGLSGVFRWWHPVTWIALVLAMPVCAFVGEPLLNVVSLRLGDYWRRPANRAHVEWL